MSESLVCVVMGSKSDWEIMSRTDALLTEFEVPHECRVLSAPRTSKAAAEYAAGLEARGVEVVICASGMAVHLAGAFAAHSLLPVLGVPIPSGDLKGMDALLATVQMPGGLAVGALGIGKAGADNAALLAVQILAGQRPELRERLRAYRQRRVEKVLAEQLP